ncbi:hypothetical protein Calle1_24 [Cellulophaga phage Calle_1]|uniref:Uncharacterized protein n=1 Tax=Cellulophaga phage Calle_1 TaxID=2745643 RepID=A0A8E4ZBA3_9CAUD|nr:hypothetical protein M1M22_gp024 [Cellulophaga phage Calle_1]QQV89706.1 hypothetical protein Calle1_24 [Cellulophaga phage Calle_1]QQV89798.1 hypothetical protein Calle2_24 [Cellulophaga phage Calle_2]QQV89921.1 hypothetical protein Calle3_24 [Cellulophaga phage Calle_3]
MSGKLLTFTTMDDKLIKRREHEGFVHERITEDILFKRMALKKQKDYKKKVRVANLDYNFLQYSYMVREWAKRNHNLTDRQIGILFYIYPLQIFTVQQFKDAIKEMGISDYTQFGKLRKDGWIIEWAKSERIKYFVLSHKGNELMKRCHKMFMLEEEIPMSARRNVIVRSNKKADEGLIGLFKLFNDKVKNK